MRKYQDNLKVGDIVLMLSPDVPRGQWPMGRIEAVHPGKDECVRVVTVRVGQKVFVRPVAKVCPLELHAEENDSE